MYVRNFVIVTNEHACGTNCFHATSTSSCFDMLVDENKKSLISLIVRPPAFAHKPLVSVYPEMALKPPLIQSSHLHRILISNG